jgi:carbon-monoxide dehydrogenase medium subunit
MKPPVFEYASPATVAEAVRLLAARGGNAKVIAGGQSLMPMLNFRLAAPELLVDLKHLKDLGGIHIDDAGVRLGAKVRWCDIEADQRLQSAHPLLCEAIKSVAHYQIRNRGTVGGSLAHADPSAEMPGVAVTCEARMTIVGPAGTRSETADAFFTGPLQTSLEPDEILTEVALPPWPHARRWAFLEFARRKGDFAMAGVALYYDLDEAGQIANVHVGAIGIADRPVRLAEVEVALNGQRLDDRLIATAAKVARDSVDPPTDIHAPGAYRRALVATLLGRGLKKSAARGV